MRTSNGRHAADQAIRSRGGARATSSKQVGMLLFLVHRSTQYALPLRSGFQSRFDGDPASTRLPLERGAWRHNYQASTNLNLTLNLSR